MAYRYPDATFRPLGSLPPSEPKMTGHDVICVHTMVGILWGTDSFFHDAGWSGTESHYGIGYDGETLQWMPLDYQADANLDGNPTVISIENADKGPGFPSWSGSDVPAFTSAQIDRLVDLLDKLCSPESHVSCPASWECHQQGIPRVLIPDTKPGRRGIGFHRQGIDPWRISGGVKWSNSIGKVCPGDRRIAQLRDVIVPRVANTEEDMTPEEHEWLRQLHIANTPYGQDANPSDARFQVQKLVERLFVRPQDGEDTVRKALLSLARRGTNDAASGETDALQVRLAEIEAKLDQLLNQP